MLDRLDELSPRVESPALGVALVDVTGLGPLVGDEPSIAARAVELVHAVTPLPLRVGIADNRWLASIAARLARVPLHGSAHPAVTVFERIAPGDGARYLADLSIALLPADEEIRSRFTLFGLTRIGPFATLSRSNVGAQFGTAGERLHALARGEDPRPIVPRRRPERVAIDVPFEPPVEPSALPFAVRRASTELCEAARVRHRAPGRASLALHLEDAPAIAIEVILPQPALEPEWIARLLVARLEAAVRGASDDVPRITLLRLVFDRLSDPWARQLPVFEPQAGRWEELRWSLERMRSRFGPGRLWRAVPERPYAALAESQARFVDIGLEADA